MEKFDVLFNLSSGEVLKLKIKNIEELLSSFDNPNRSLYKHTDGEGVSFVIDLSKVECISYIDNDILEEEGKEINEEITKFM